ncbi:MAG: hypothetical protein KDA22_05645 [Phycisphaerales bacterium]|nr:hypothetical protein [Phycisphaerales bacterium]
MNEFTPPSDHQPESNPDRDFLDDVQSLVEDEGPTLSEEDRRIVDALLSGGLDRSALTALPATDRSRGEALLHLLGLLDDYPISDADGTLVDATMARIDRHDRESEMRMRLDPVVDRSGGRVLRVRLHDLVTIAALLLIGVSIGWPILSKVRQSSVDAGCAANLRSMGTALANYAGDSNGSLPMMTAGLLGGTWDTMRNSDNLELLPQLGYCELGHLDCPGHQGYGPSYSFAMPSRGKAQPWMQQPTKVVLADRNPVMDHLRMGLRPVDLLLPSPNHGHRGQNVLFGSLAVEWDVVPIVRHEDGQLDNFWLVRFGDGREDLRPGSAPADASDNFLAH